MSFEAKAAKDGKYHQADVEVISDSRNWPRKQQQQNTQEVAKSTKEEKSTEVEESDDDAEDQVI